MFSKIVHHRSPKRASRDFNRGMAGRLSTLAVEFGGRPKPHPNTSLARFINMEGVAAPVTWLRHFLPMGVSSHSSINYTIRVLAANLANGMLVVADGAFTSWASPFQSTVRPSHNHLGSSFMLVASLGSYPFGHPHK